MYTDGMHGRSHEGNVSEFFYFFLGWGGGGGGGGGVDLCVYFSCVILNFHVSDDA